MTQQYGSFLLEVTLPLELRAIYTLEASSTKLQNLGLSKSSCIVQIAGLKFPSTSRPIDNLILPSLKQA